MLSRISIRLLIQYSSGWGNFSLAAVKSFDANITIIGNFVPSAKNSILVPCREIKGES